MSSWGEYIHVICLFSHDYDFVFRQKFDTITYIDHELIVD